MCAGVGNAQVGVPGLRPPLLAALPRHSAETESYRAVPALGLRKHSDGISQSRLAKREHIANATVERWLGAYLRLVVHERIGRQCPRIPGVDEHFFTHRRGYATTFCDLRITRSTTWRSARSETTLESYLNRLEGKQRVEVVCMDLAATYRALVRKHFPHARIVADRFQASALSIVIF